MKSENPTPAALGRGPGQKAGNSNPDYTPPHSSINVILDRLEGVRDNGRGRWVARCPAHDDKSPSLSLKEVDDRVLIHCHAGCGAADIVAAVGLELADLFDRPLSHHRPAQRRQRIPAHKVLDAVSHALSVVVLADTDIRHGRLLSNDDWEAVDNALAVLSEARRAA